MIGAVRRVLRRGFDLIERPFERLFGPALNPLAQLGALGFFFFWIVAVSGIYLFIFFDTGIERAYQSVEYLTQDHWFHAGVMRSFHRYASDLMVVMVVVHLLREFSLDHYRGVRWFSWFTGLPIYERYLTTRSARVAELLRERGVALFSGPGAPPRGLRGETATTDLAVGAHFTNDDFDITGPPGFIQDSSGVILGLKLETSRGEILKGILEATTFYLRECFETLPGTGIVINEFYAVGGGSKSAAWTFSENRAPPISEAISVLRMLFSIGDLFHIHTQNRKCDGADA